MSGGLMVIVGLVLAIAGIWSVRLVLITAGAGAAWLLADAFEASTGTALLIAAGGGLLAFVVGLIAARILFFAVGSIVGAVVGARVFAILDTGDASILLAVIFVPAIAVLGAIAAEKWRQRFLGWACAIGGSGLVLSGLGRMAPDSLGFLSDPTGPASQATSTLLWIGLAIVGRLAQRSLSKSDETADAS